MGPWRLIHTWEGEPGANMALDEALLEVGPPEPTLRFYSWKPAALSLGYFQRARDVPAAAEAEVVVRRLTGGGAIHHDRELTFSIVAPESAAPYRGEVRASYVRVHAWIARALADFGVHAALREDRQLASDRAGTGMCFHDSTPLDLAWGGAKGVGTAQRRKGGRVLHHGSIKLARDPREPGVAVVDVDDVAETRERLAAALVDVIGAELGCAFTRGDPSAEERRWTELRAPHFTSPAFVERR